MSIDGSGPWADTKQAFWSLAIGVPPAILILRLWVESGGSLPITLLLAANVSPISLLTVVVTTASWLYSAVVVNALAIAHIFARSDPSSVTRHAFIGWAVTSPLWFRLSAFLLALATWSLIYLPLLLFCALAVLWNRPGSEPHRVVHWLVPKLAAIAAVAATYPMIRDAYRAQLWLVLTLVVAPLAGLLLGAIGPIPAGIVRWYWATTKLIVWGLLALTVVPVLTAPILPLEVLVTSDGSGGEIPRRGHIISVDDNSTALLLDQGGVEFIANSDIERRILCSDESEVPRYRLWLYGFHVEDSPLQAIGRLNRPNITADHWCHAALHTAQ